MATVPYDVDEPSDTDLTDAVRTGTVAAYGALYERHVTAAYNLARQLTRSRAEMDDLVSEAFAKVLDMLLAGRGPDAAFRAYLLTVLRNLAYDKSRRDRKVALSDDVTTVSGVPAEAVRTEFDDTALSGLERSLAARAFARLPERWQAVLWHIEIEGESPVDVAPVFGVTPNGVSALAYRAREGLRQAYLQEHLADLGSGPGVAQCRTAVGRLGAWTRDALSRREKAQVETHLDGCARCRALAEELADVNGALRGLVAPLVLGVGVAGYLATTGGASLAAVTAGTAAGAAGAGAAGVAAAGPRQLLGVATSGVALTAALIVGLTVRDTSQPIPAVKPVPVQDQKTVPAAPPAGPPAMTPPQPTDPPATNPPTPPTTEPPTTAPPTTGPPTTPPATTLPPATAPPPTTEQPATPPTTKPPAPKPPTTKPLTTKPPRSWTPPGRTDPVPADPPGHRPDREPPPGRGEKPPPIVPT